MLLSCGDALIDFVPAKAADGRDALVPMVGGSCLNIAIGMARLGASAGFVGGISTDLFGRMIAVHAQASGVDLSHATRCPRPTTLAFVRHVDGDAQYAFLVKTAAFLHVNVQDVPEDGVLALNYFLTLSRAAKSRSIVPPPPNTGTRAVVTKMPKNQIQF